LEKKKAVIEEQAALFGVLADPTRLKLLRMLLQQSEPDALCVNALAYHLGVTQPAVSQHLKLLKNAGLVQGEKRGYRVHYFVRREALKEAQELISKALQSSEGESGGNSPEESESETE
jgi:DNA-binding transcriptional ArsR family regulator